MMTRVCRKCGSKTRYFRTVKESEYQNRYYCLDSYNCDRNYSRKKNAVLPGEMNYHAIANYTRNALSLQNVSGANLPAEPASDDRSVPSKW